MIPIELPPEDPTIRIGNMQLRCSWAWSTFGLGFDVSPGVGFYSVCLGFLSIELFPTGTVG